MRTPRSIPASSALLLLLAVALLAGCGNDDGGAQLTARVVDGSAVASSSAQEACTEDLVREAIDNSDAVAPDLEYEISYLECAGGFGWALLDPIAENFDTAIVLLRVADTDVELLDLGTSLCLADYGIPADVAAQIAPPGFDPAGDCPAVSAPPDAEPGEPIQDEPDFTG